MITHYKIKYLGVRGAGGWQADNIKIIKCSVKTKITGRLLKTFCCCLIYQNKSKLDCIVIVFKPHKATNEKPYILNLLIIVAQYFYQLSHCLPTDYYFVMTTCLLLTSQTDKLMLSAPFVFLGRCVHKYCTSISWV